MHRAPAITARAKWDFRADCVLSQAKRAVRMHDPQLDVSICLGDQTGLTSSSAASVRVMSSSADR